MPTINQTIKKIHNFANLPQGWRFGEGDAIAENKRMFAVRLIEYAGENGIERMNAFALVDGGILVSFYVGDYALDLTIEANESLTYAEDYKDEQLDFTEHLCLDNAYNKIWQFSQRIQNISESSIQTSMSQNSADLRVPPLPRRQRTTAYPSSRETVRLNAVKRSADTYQYTIPNSRASHQSTGMSH